MELGTADVIRPEGSGRSLLRHGRRRGRVPSDRRRAGGLGGGTIDVETRSGQSAEGDHEEQEQNKQGREQHQLGGDAPALIAPHSASSLKMRDPHGACPGLVYASLGPTAVALTGRENNPTMLSARPVTTSVVVAAVFVAVMSGLTSTPDPS
jgi:hypothetical protein